MDAVKSGGIAGRQGENSNGGEASQATTQRWGNGLEEQRQKETAIPCRAGARCSLVPVTAVGGPGRNPVDADVGLYTQDRLVLQLRRHLGSALRATGAGRGNGDRLGAGSFGYAATSVYATSAPVPPGSGD